MLCDSWDGWAVRSGSGVIVQISSISGRVVTPLFGMYQASKHALEAMSEAMAYEVEHFGIRVVLVEPGNVNTSPYIGGTPALLEGRSAYQELQQRIAESRKPRGLSVSEPLEVAEAIVAAIEDPATPLRVVTGASAKKMDAVRRQSTDEQYVRWLWQETKVEW